MRVSHIGAAPTGCMAEVGCMDSETLSLRCPIETGYQARAPDMRFFAKEMCGFVNE